MAQETARPAVRTESARSHVEIRLTHGIARTGALARVLAHDRGFLTADIAAAATLVASAPGPHAAPLIPVEDGVAVAADRQVLGAVVMNVLQNAFKFTRPRTTVTLRVGASVERVLLEVQDECGGLACRDTSDLFRPFEQRSANRTGLGLGLAFSRWGAEANHGRIYARNLPDVGCIFTVDLPRVAAPALASAISIEAGTPDEDCRVERQTRGG